LRRVITGRTARTLLTVGVIVAIFAGVLPRITDYSAAWALVRHMHPGEVVLVSVLGLVNLFSYAPLWMAAMPGLTLGRAVMSDQASTAVSNTVPVGFAFGVGTNVAMYHSFGFSAAVITRGVALTGIWNNLVKLATPAVALGGLAVVGDVDPRLAVAALTGSALLVLGAAGLALTVTHGQAARALARGAERLAGRAARLVRREPPSGWVARTDRFRAGSLDLIRARWIHLTVAAVVSHGLLFVLLLACLHAVADASAELHWLSVLAVFSLTRLVTIVPITPGALGIAELSYVAGLSAAGIGAATAAGAVLLFRFLTWFLPIPLGAASWLAWRQGLGRVAPAAREPARAG
jgi:putative heme transporter